jgi:hypothetical protein
MIVISRLKSGSISVNTSEFSGMFYSDAKGGYVVHPREESGRDRIVAETKNLIHLYWYSDWDLVVITKQVITIHRTLVNGAVIGSLAKNGRRKVTCVLPDEQGNSNDEDYANMADLLQSLSERWCW